MSTDSSLAAKMARTLGPYHGFIYFSPEADAAYSALGLHQRQGYFASRVAALGAASPELVLATFYNFDPDLVRRCIPSAWDHATPAQILEARHGAADAGLRRMLGDAVESAEMIEAAELAVEATTELDPVGRALFAGHQALNMFDVFVEPHMRLWWAETLLREHRGDGHIAALTAAGIDGCQALVMHAAMGVGVDKDVLKSTRARTDADWNAAVDGLAARGLVDANGEFTEAGRTLRTDIERTTDERAMAPWEHLGADRSNRLRELVRPFSKTIASAMFGG